MCEEEEEEEEAILSITIIQRKTNVVNLIGLDARTLRPPFVINDKIWVNEAYSVVDACMCLSTVRVAIRLRHIFWLG